VSDLARLPALDALICVTLRRSLPLPVPHWKLVPQRVVAGIGCRRDTPFLLCTLLDRQLAAQRLDPLALKAIGSVSLKANEPGLRQLAHRCRVPFETFSADALREHEHRFPASSFVRETVGVGSVSGPVAWLLSQGNCPAKPCVSRASLLLWEFHTDVKRNRNWPWLAGDDDHGSRGSPAGGRDRGGLQDLHPPGKSLYRRQAGDQNRHVQRD
jgi:hypothetical protein